MPELLIEPLETLTKLVNDPLIEQKLKKYKREDQLEIFSFIQKLMVDEIRFVLNSYQEAAKLVDNYQGNVH